MEFYICRIISGLLVCYVLLIEDAGSTSVVDRLTELERTVRDQQRLLWQQDNRIKELEHRQGALEVTVKDQQQLLLKQDRYVKEQTRSLVRYQRQIMELNARVRNHEARLERFWTGLKPICTPVVEAEGGIDNSKNAKNADQEFIVEKEHPRIVQRESVGSYTVKRLLNTQAGQIAFQAIMTGTDTCVNDHEVLVFNSEELDIGGGYNSQDGIYAVPQAGTYFLTFTINSYDGEYYVAELVVNGTPRHWIIADSYNTINPVTATGNILLQVNAGDHVFIRRRQGIGCKATTSYGRTLFAGFKLF